MSKVSFNSVILCVIVISGFVVFWQFLGSTASRNPDEAWYVGPPNARWMITEYADLECPYCRAYTPVLKRWVIEQGNVKLKWHHFPLESHGPAAQQEAKLVQCAGYLGGAGTFWEAIDQVLLRSRGNGQGFSGDLELLNVSVEALARCVRSNQEVAAKIERHVEIAHERGISATPTLEVTDTQFGRSVRLEGSVDGATLLSVIDALAAQAARRKE
ncbi:DsbA family protein [Pseudomonas mosselii]|uniref:DsbA family protein n=1 Tax=Pseudomonas mosselii TaxID=78327 RepID=UPI001BD44512|nr:DsbA family protein [Pseudomonas mosselii]MBS9759790.1 DsbA family protein [Pseudomonas mosselii]